MQRKHLILVFGALLYSGVIWFADPNVLGFLEWAVFFWLGVSAATIAIVTSLLAGGTGHSRRSRLKMLAVGLMWGGLVGAAMPLNRLVQQCAVIEAKAYLASIAPLLEAYRQTHGSYPDTLSELPSAPPLPRLLRRFGYLSAGQTYYSFSIPQPGGDTWDYDSATGTWDISE